MDTIPESDVTEGGGGEINLIFGREPSRVIANSNCVLIEPIRTPNGELINPQLLILWSLNTLRVRIEKSLNPIQVSLNSHQLSLISNLRNLLC